MAESLIGSLASAGGGETANAGTVQEGVDPKAAVPPSGGEATPASEGVPTGDWREGLSIEEIQKLARFKDPKSVAKSYLELERRLGSSISVPGENAKPEEIRAFYSKLGVPEKPEGYELKTPSEADGWSKTVEAQARERFLKAGLTPRQAQEMIDLHVEFVEQGAQSLNEGAKQAEAQLKSEWGSGFKKNFGFFEQGILHYFGPEAFELLKRSPLGNSVPFIKGLALMGAQLTEAGYIPGELPDSDDIQAKIAALTADPKGPLRNKSHPGRELALKQYEDLHKQLVQLEQFKK